MNFNWVDLDLSSLAKRFKIEETARVNGSNNEPRIDSSSISRKEEEIITFISSHYQNETTKNLELSFDVYEGPIQDCKSYEKQNGHKEQFMDERRNWETLFSQISLKINNIKSSLIEINQRIAEYRQFNSIHAGREPIVKTRFALFLMVMAPLLMASIEIFLNFGILGESLSGREALVASIIISLVNIGFSLVVGRKVFTHLINPTFDSFNKALLISLVVIWFLIIIYVNLLAAVFRGLIDQSNATYDLSKIETLAQDALTKSVWPFDNFTDLTFTSVILLLTGILFALLSALDGYNFDDPLSGYGSLGRKLERKKEEKQNLINNALKDFDALRENAFIELERKKNLRMSKSKEHANLIDKLQIDKSKFEAFNSSIEETLNSLINLYRTTNLAHRPDQSIPKIYEDQSSINKREFFEIHASLEAEYMNDNEKNVYISEVNGLIELEFDKSHGEYTDYFREQNIILMNFLDDT